MERQRFLVLISLVKLERKTGRASQVKGEEGPLPSLKKKIFFRMNKWKSFFKNFCTFI